MLPVCRCSLGITGSSLRRRRWKRKFFTLRHEHEADERFLPVPVCIHAKREWRIGVCWRHGGRWRGARLWTNQVCAASVDRNLGNENMAQLAKFRRDGEIDRGMCLLFLLVSTTKNRELLEHVCQVPALRTCVHFPNDENGSFLRKNLDCLDMVTLRGVSKKERNIRIWMIAYGLSSSRLVNACQSSRGPAIEALEHDVIVTLHDDKIR